MNYLTQYDFVVYGLMLGFVILILLVCLLKAAHGSVEMGGPIGCVDLCALAVNCLDKRRKKRPEMKKVYKTT